MWRALAVDWDIPGLVIAHGIPYFIAYFVASLLLALLLRYVPTGAAGAMFDHWSILQFLDHASATGVMNAQMMDDAFKLVMR